MPADGTKVVRTAKGYMVGFAMDLGQPGYEFKRGPITYLRHIAGWGEAVTFFPERGIDLIHSFNAVPITTRPWLLTFEDHLPRTPPDDRLGLPQRLIRPRLLGSRCHRVLALSEYAIRQYRYMNRDWDKLTELDKKVELFYPRLAVTHDAVKPAPQELRLAFVGRDAMRKGLPALLDAHRRLRAGGVPVHTDVVTSLDWAADDYIGPSDENAVAAMRSALDQEGVVVHGETPNHHVREIMHRATFLAFPTLHDTFGYVAIEALAAGTPVIATNTAALPEVVEEGKTGFLLDIENDANVGKWVGTYRRDDDDYTELYTATVASLGEQMAERLQRFWETERDSYPAMSAASLDLVRTRFSIEDGRRRLEQLYAEALA